MELLSPAGNFDALVAAVQSGADAVYLGFGGFNARRSAGNFTDDDFKRAVEYCHLRGVKVHVTLNTLIKENELDDFANAALEAAHVGADAVIVQDLGGAALLRQLCPGLKLHMSTQAACCNAAGVRFARAHGYDRVVLARECSLDEIALCAREGVEIETFVHGALCVCFSGQCLFSSLVGGRSGNRGMCAQPCRLNYELCGAHAASGCLLSPRDIMLLNDLPALERAGVCSLKIEGRLKRPEYVSEVTRIYRRALDMLREHPEKYAPDADDVTALKQIFNRGGFSRAYLNANFRDSDIIYSKRPNNMGVHVGEVLRSRGGNLQLNLDTPLDAGDQIALRRDDCEIGFELKRNLAAGLCELNAGDMQQSRDMTGAHVFRAAGIRQLERARDVCRVEHKSLPVDMYVRLHIGQAAKLVIHTAVDKNESDISDIVVETMGTVVCPAQKKPLSVDSVRAQLEKLGGTALEVGTIDIEVDKNAFLPVSALNELRREAVDKYTTEVLNRRRGCPAPTRQTVHNRREADKGICCDKPLLIVQSQNLADASLGDAFYWEPEYVTYGELDSALSLYTGNANIYLRVPNMLSEHELTEINKFANAHAAAFRGCVLTNISQLTLKWPGMLVADMNLNAWNSRTLELLKACGITRMTASLELTAGEIKQACCPDTERELIVYGRVTLMTMRHCPINVLSQLKHADCRLCDGRHGLKQCRLIDRKRVSFPLGHYRGASGCYTQIFNSVPHDLRGRFNRLPDCNAMRLIFTDELPETRRNIVRDIEEALCGHRKAYTEVRGATAGHYFRGVE